MHNMASSQSGRRESKLFHSVLCDGCDQLIKGVRFKCGNCANFDLCEKCEVNSLHTHNEEHVFLKIKRPTNLAGMTACASFRPSLNQNLYREYVPCSKLSHLTSLYCGVKPDTKQDALEKSRSAPGLISQEMVEIKKDTGFSSASGKVADNEETNSKKVACEEDVGCESDDGYSDVASDLSISSQSFDVISDHGDLGHRELVTSTSCSEDEDDEFVLVDLPKCFDLSQFEPSKGDLLSDSDTESISECVSSADESTTDEANYDSDANAKDDVLQVVDPDTQAVSPDTQVEAVDEKIPTTPTNEKPGVEGELDEDPEDSEKGNDSDTLEDVANQVFTMAVEAGQKAARDVMKFLTQLDEYEPPKDDWTPSNPSWSPPENSWTPPAPYVPPKSDYVLPKSTYIPPQYSSNSKQSDAATNTYPEGTIPGAYDLMQPQQGAAGSCGVRQRPMDYPAREDAVLALFSDRKTFNSPLVASTI